MRNLNYLIFWFLYIFLFGMALFATQVNAAFKDLSLNTSVYINKNGEANVQEVITIYANGSSVKDYLLAKKALNLTLSDWVQLTNSKLLTPHVFYKSYEDFYFVPENIIKYGDYGIARIRIFYTIKDAANVTVVAPRLVKYTVNPNIFKFEVGKSGVILMDNATLAIYLPGNAIVEKVFPPPDSPITSEKNFTTNYVLWNSGEPFSSFSLVFYMRMGIDEEVMDFLRSVKNFALQNILWIVLAAAVAGIFVVVKIALKTKKEEMKKQ